MSGWQPEQYEPRQQPQYESAIPPQFRQHGQYGQQDRDQQYQPPEPQYEPRPHYQQRRRQTGLYTAWAVAAVAILLAAGGWYTALKEHHSGTATAAAAVAQPDTEAGVRAAATAFYAFYSAGQWDQAWQGLAPSVQQKIHESTWTAVHDACPGPTAGLAREIKSVTVSGTTAVITETIAGALGKLGTVSDPWTYTGSRWGLALPASSTAVFRHSSVKADVAAAKKAGSCG